MIVLRFVGYTIILGVNIIEHPEFYSPDVKVELLKKDRKKFMKHLCSLFSITQFSLSCVYLFKQDSTGAECGTASESAEDGGEDGVFRRGVHEQPEASGGRASEDTYGAEQPHGEV